MNIVYLFSYTYNFACIKNRLNCFCKMRDDAFMRKFQNLHFFFGCWISYFNFKKKTIELRLRQTIRAFVFNRILSSKYHKWLRNRVRNSINRYLLLFHHFKQRSLRFCRRTIDLINQNNVAENWTILKTEFCSLRIENRSSDHITRHKIGCELYSTKRNINTTCKLFCCECFRNTRNSFNQYMT